MRDAATPPDDGPDAHHPATPTPHQRAAAIRTHTHDVMTRVQQRRDSPHWQDNDTSRRRYQLTADSLAALDALPDPDTHDAVTELIDAIRPILTEWRPSRPSPEQAIYAAVERHHRATL